MLENGKSKINDTFNELQIEIPAKRNWFIIVFSILWMGGWYVGFITATKSFGVDLFMTVWLLGWTLGGLFVVFSLLWSMFGKEIIQIDYENMIFERSIFGVGVKKILILAEVSNVRYEYVDTSMFANRRNSFSTMGIGTGPVKIDYGFKTYSFGLAVDEAEANYLVELIKKKIKK